MPLPSIRMIFLRLFWACMLVWGVTAQASTISPEKNAFNRVKLLERQILLSEQIGTAVCLMLADVKAASQSDKARGAADLFATVQQALRTGDENMAILPERSAAVRTALDEIDAVFDTYRAATLQLVNNDLHTVPASQVMRLDDVLMVLVQQAVMIVDDEYGAASATKAKRAKLSKARHQTLLTQRLAKNMCYIMLNINADAMREELRDTLAAFSKAQSQLRNAPAVKPAVIKKLDAVDALWTDLAALAQPLTEQGTVSSDTLILALDLSNKLLFKTKQVARGFAR